MPAFDFGEMALTGRIPVLGADEACGLSVWTGVQDEQRQHGLQLLRSGPLLCVRPSVCCLPSHNLKLAMMSCPGTNVVSCCQLFTHVHRPFRLARLPPLAASRSDYVTDIACGATRAN
eukprot:3886882-Rhodomonas_salina.3